ncbi:hypothetical protein BDV95DRAFT_391416 [Massariosphaeria phaeospora]|uniref:Survival motor neuron Tudor domain-containing protein n=1 Tax=Massariosphaeria phaeospora TaxID=100035 RepID=A0A7C8M9C3_9PLEO|nr:hypothetical protein BDV95DRAFT_391416 [Massariosphaeria phaeospora]
MAPTITLDDKNAWDDSALISSWDEAYAEYKYYSIQAEGKRLEDVLSAEELRELREDHGDLIEDVEPRSSAGSNIHADQEDVDLLHEETHGNGPAGLGETNAEEPTVSGHQGPPEVAETPRLLHDGAPTATLPQAILGSVQDENLKNLMMSWYYAGYYTAVCTAQQAPSPGPPKGT